jgi:hypothetical protein
VADGADLAHDNHDGEPLRLDQLTGMLNNG